MLAAMFWTVSRLKINLSKSEIVPVGEVGDVEWLASILGCGVVSIRIKYLGLPLDAKYKDSLLRRWKIDWRGGRGCFYQMMGG
jgi:hypothetical protein